MARIAMLSAATTNATSAAIQQSAAHQFGGDEISFQYTGTWAAATLTLQQSNDGGTTWTPITGGAVTANAVINHIIGAGSQIRAVITDAASPISHSISLFASGHIEAV